MRNPTWSGLIVLLVLSLSMGLTGCPNPELPDPDTSPPVFLGVDELTVLGNTQIQVEWGIAVDDTTDPAEMTFRVYVAETSGDQDFGSSTLDVTGTTFSGVVSDLLPGYTYFIVVRAEDEAGNIDSNTEELSARTTSDPLQIATSTLGYAVEGVAYSAVLGRTGGFGPSVWTVEAGALPAGLSLNSSTGAVEGTPGGGTAGSTYDFTAGLTDGETSTTMELTLQVKAEVVLATGTPLYTLPETAFSHTVSAGGGEEPYLFGATGLPAGLSINTATGEISGSTEAGTAGSSHTASITVTDSSTPALTDSGTVTIGVIEGTTLHVAPGGSGHGLTVGAPFGFIQDALDLAIDAVTIQLADGTYTGARNRNLETRGKALTITGTSAANCVIDCEGLGRGFFVRAGETSSTIIENLTITNGDATVAPSQLIDGGGAIALQSTSPTIRNCVFTNGTARVGGAIQFYYSDATVTDCQFTGNTSTQVGGATSCYQSTYTIDRCVFRDNYSPGGGASHVGSGATIANSLFANNEALSGGGISLNFASASIVNCTIVANHAIGSTTAELGGGGLYVRTWGPTVSNSIIWGNTVGTDGVGAEIYLRQGDLLLDSCIYGNSAGDVGARAGDGGVLVPTNCSTANPSFVSTGSPGIGGGGDFHLSVSTSPAVDSGTSSVSAAYGSLDLDGTTRVVDGDGTAGASVDMGAYEYH